MLSLHVASSLEQLGHVGSWILKGREAAALARLRADAFAFDLIYEQLVSEGRSSALGKCCVFWFVWIDLISSISPPQAKIDECSSCGSLLPIDSPPPTATMAANHQAIVSTSITTSTTTTDRTFSAGGSSVSC